jgi:predicted naringenin-chalcone synthase
MPENEYSRRQCTIIDSIETANPRFAVTQADACDFMLRTKGLSESLRKRIPQIYERSAIDRRFSCLEDYTRTPDLFEFYPNTSLLHPAPSTGTRNEVYRQESIALAEEAARACLVQSKTSANDITHIIVVSCTGFFAPGIDILLINRLGLPANTQRTVIGFMGCYAAFNGLKAADAICKSTPDARVLLVCVELCTLHFQIEDTLESVIVNALFSDGCAACLLKAGDRTDSPGKLIIRDFECHLDSHSLDAMSWTIGDTGFKMGLSPKVPDIISSALPSFVATLANRNSLSREDIFFWAVHPGGRQVLDRTVVAMDIGPEVLEESYSILREYGNMSSPTVLFILKRIMERSDTKGSQGLALAFGPGLTIEGCLLEVGG